MHFNGNKTNGGNTRFNYKPTAIPTLQLLSKITDDTQYNVICPRINDIAATFDRTNHPSGGFITLVMSAAARSGYADTDPMLTFNIYHIRKTKLPRESYWRPQHDICGGAA
jgi:hypothetical protein